MERIDEPSSAQLNINDLPHEILKFIFSFLNIRERIKIERVCKNWRYIGTNFQWTIKEIKFKRNSNLDAIDLTDYMLEEILKRCGKCVLVIDLTGCSRLTSKALSIIGDHCPNLRSVKFNHGHLTDSNLEYFSSKCTKLREAVLIGREYGEDGLRSFLKSCQELEVLHIEDNDNISGLCFQFISAKVKKLTLTRCNRLMSEGFLKLEKCKCIEHLELCYFHGFDHTSLEEVLKQNYNSLKHLGMTGDFLSQIYYEELPFELLIKLESISFERSYYIRDETLFQISNKCKSLRTLNISYTDITDMGLKHLTTSLLLTTLNVSCIKYITDESIIPLAMVGKLESLSIRHNENITDNACKMLAVHCTKLKYLDLCFCTRITDVTAHSFINAMKLRDDGHRELKIFVYETKIRVFIEEEEFIIAYFFPEALGKQANYCCTTEYYD